MVYENLLIIKLIPNLTQNNNDAFVQEEKQYDMVNYKIIEISKIFKLLKTSSSIRYSGYTDDTYH